MVISRRINVLQFSNAIVRAGAEEHILSLLRCLDRKRFRAIFAAHPRLIESVRSDLPPDVEAIGLTLEEPYNFGAALYLARILRKRHIDILHSHMFQASRLASPVGRLAGVPITIETSHGRESWRRGWLKGSFFIDRLVGHCATYVIAVSAATADYLVREKRLKEHKVIVIRNGIPVERFDPSRAPSADILRALNIDQGAPIALTLARLEPQKAHRVLLEAWKSVAAAYPKARLICLGDGQLRKELQAQADALGIASSVRFVGRQTNVADWLALSSFTVLPSLHEGLPLVALESLAAGRAVVATAVDGTTEVILDEENGLLVPPREVAPLSAAIMRLIASPDLALRLGFAGRRFVEERFCERRQVAETEALYETALRQYQHFSAAGAGDLASEGRAG